MRYLLNTSTPPVETETDLITLSEAKNFLQVTENDAFEHDFINQLIVAAVRDIELMTNRSILTQTWDVILDRFEDGVMHLDKTPLTLVTHIKYFDSDEVWQTWSSSNYRVSKSAGAIEPVDGWPSTYSRIDVAEVRIVCGDTVDDVPQPIKDAIKYRLAELYHDRDHQEDISRLVAPYTRLVLA